MREKRAGNRSADEQREHGAARSALRRIRIDRGRERHVQPRRFFASSERLPGNVNDRQQCCTPRRFANRPRETKPFVQSEFAPAGPWKAPARIRHDRNRAPGRAHDLAIDHLH